MSRRRFLTENSNEKVPIMTQKQPGNIKEFTYMKMI